jgi:acyl-CoA thioesterase-1
MTAPIQKEIMSLRHLLSYLLVTFFFSGQAVCPQAAADQSHTTSHAATTQTRRTVLFFGDSLTAGYGLLPEQAFPALIQAKIDSLGWPYTVVNAGVSGETSSGGRRRIDWVLRQPVDVFVLELGGNDGLRGVPLATTAQNLQAILDQVKKKYPQTAQIVAGMQIPPNLGHEYTAQFRAIFPALAKKNNATLIPFLLEGVGGVPKLNLPDGIHPTEEGHIRVATTVWDYLQPVLKNTMVPAKSP